MKRAEEHSAPPDRRPGRWRALQRRAADRRAAGLPDRRLDCQNAAELIGFAVYTRDGEVGRIEDFCFEEESMGVTEVVVVAGRRRIWRKRLFVPLSAIERVDARKRKIYIRPDPEEIRQWSRGRKSCFT